MPDAPSQKPEDLPQVINNVPAVVRDFMTGAEVSVGRCSLQFVEHTDKLRAMRELFRGHYRAGSQADAENLSSHLIRLMSQGAPAHKLIVDYENTQWDFTAKFELGEGTLFAFSGRAEPVKL